MTTIAETLDTLRRQPEGFTISVQPCKARRTAYIAASAYSGYRLIESDSHAVIMDRLTLDAAKTLRDAYNAAATSELA